MLPNHCILCLVAISPPALICATCNQSLPLNINPCRRCATPLPTGTPPGQLCGFCHRHPPAFDRAVAPLIYANPANTLINHFKHQSHLHKGKALASILADQLSTQLTASDRPDYIAPVPLHWRRRFRRGFDQARWLTGFLARHIEVPVNDSLIKRQRSTQSQQGLSRRQRLQNLAKAFTVAPSSRPAIENRHIALVDDVITTGTTLDTLATLLKKQGAARVDIWCLARTPLEKIRR